MLIFTSGSLSVARTILNGHNFVAQMCRAYSYKSAISLDKLYPNINLDITAKLSSSKFNGDDEKFSGLIPIGIWY
jgi:hypothetical protein